MKKILFTIVCLLFAGATIWAQSPNLMNYQGVARNSAGSPLANTNISLRLTLHDGSSTGSTVYSETQSVTTNSFGLYNASIGAGTVVSGTFAGINWSSGSKWMQVEIDPAGGSSYTSVGTSQLLSVPFALYAAAGPSGGAGGVSSVTAGSGLSGGTITSTGTISMPNVGTAGTYGSATQVPVITTDAEGRVSNVTLAAISGGGGGVTSTGTANYVPKFTSATAVGNSAIYQNGTSIGIGTTTPAATFTTATATDSIAGYFTSTSASPAINHGIVEIDYAGTNDNVFAAVIDAYNVTNNHATVGAEGVGTSDGFLGIGITTYTSGGTNNTRGTEGDSYGDDVSEGVAGIASNNVGTPSLSLGVVGSATGGITNYAGYFAGDIYVGGTVYATTKSFKIDDPLDPANKYLIHTCVESNEMTTVYSGNVTSDASGSAAVTLPSYFQALNKDFRYQLTVIGSFAQAMVAQEVSGNQFVINTSVPNVKVSWQVTGVRQDAWANAHPVVAEVDKESFNKGKYLSAKEFGQPDSKQIGADLIKPSNKGVRPQTTPQTAIK